MEFYCDTQTLKDLRVFGVSGEKSIIGLFSPKTIGGQNKLSEFFKNPVNNLTEIQNRSVAIQSIAKRNLIFDFSREELDFAEYYLKQAFAFDDTSPQGLLRAIKARLQPSNINYILERGINIIDKLLVYVPDVFGDKEFESDLIKDHIDNIRAIKTSVNDLKGTGKTKFTALLNLDQLFRHSKNQQILSFIDFVYLLDVINSITITTRELNLSYPSFLSGRNLQFELEGFFHPLLSAPVANDIVFNENMNLCLLTGANMSGKSSALKAIGVCLYLAHIGFPVPAKNMTTTVFNGLYSTINLSDDIVTGHSHFYKEVLRIKEVAVKIGRLNHLFVIFDELFRGTNVKDAYDASLAIVTAFTQIKSSAFIISTHITEIADQLTHQNVFFKCLSTGMVDNQAFYTYKLNDGISNERLGMWIVNNEKLVDIINSQVQLKTPIPSQSPNKTAYLKP